MPYTRIHTYIHTYTRAIGDLTYLAYLSFTHIRDCTDNGLCELGKLVHLYSLSLEWTNLEDVGLSSFAPLVKLKSLCLAGTNITGIGFRDLSGLTVLDFLDLSNCNYLNDDGIHACACAFKALSYLALGLPGNDLTSAAWRHLAAYASPTLTNLDMMTGGMTPEDLLVLNRWGHSDGGRLVLNRWVDF